MASREHLVFAYGSNMHRPDLERWFREKKHAVEGILGAEPAELPGWRLVWNYFAKGRRGGAANVEPAEGENLHGVVLRVDDRALDAIDRKEALDVCYGRREVTARLSLSGREVTVWLYEVLPAKRRPETTWPHPDYHRLLVEGARAFALPAAWVAKLEAIPTAEYDVETARLLVVHEPAARAGGG